MKGMIIYAIGWKKVIGFFILCVAFFSCNNKKGDTAVDPEDIYFNYKITGEEGDDNLTVMLQYRVGGEEGDALSMDKVTLDGEILPADSTKMTGTFYELHKPIAAFTGKHSILFTGINKKEYKEEFDFRPVTLLTPVADTIGRSEMVFEFDGLEPKDYLTVLLSDTSYINNGINHVAIVVNGRLVIRQSDLENLANGPVQIEFIREYEKPVKNGTKGGGRLLITYSLKREFFLKD